MYVTQPITSAVSPDSRRVLLKGGVSNTAPQPGLGSGSSPPLTARHSVAPKFGSSVGWSTIIGPNALSQCFSDILGVWGPKLPLVRSKTQFFEESFLEFVEDAAFYFAVPTAAFGLHKVYQNLAKLNSNNAAEVIGKGVAGKTKELTRELVAAKFGTLAGALAIASAVEYMIQHAKNVITAKQFNTKNFTAVAGLEGAQNKAAKGEMDPVEKAKRRSWQVPALFGSVLAASLLAPRMILKHEAVEKLARKALTYVDFGKDPFDISKMILGILAGVGAVSYVDAARDSLERKETVTRLAVVIPYMLFGKELVGYGLAKYYETFGKVKQGEQTVKLADLKKSHQLSLTNGKKPWQQFLEKESFMNMGVVHKDLAPVFEELAKKGKGLSKPLEEGLYKIHGNIGVWSYILSAAISGVGINWIAYRQTKERFRRQQEAQKQQLAQTIPYASAPAASPFGYPGKSPNGFTLPQAQKSFAPATTPAPLFPVAAFGQTPAQWSRFNGQAQA